RVFINDLSKSQLNRALTMPISDRLRFANKRGQMMITNLAESRTKRRIKDDTEAKLGGFVHPGALQIINITDAFPPETRKHVLAHEARHLMQFRNDPRLIRPGKSSVTAANYENIFS
ncbi:hypothetical protein V6O07_12710, partial [Arthrospira platensis SPKY2]